MFEPPLISHSTFLFAESPSQIDLAIARAAECVSPLKNFISVFKYTTAFARLSKCVFNLYELSDVDRRNGVGHERGSTISDQEKQEMQTFARKLTLNVETFEASLDTSETVALMSPELR